MNKTLKYTATQIDAAIKKIIGLDTSIINNLINNKYDNATLSGNILKLYANGVEKKSLTLPTSSGGGSGTPGTDGREIELSVQAGYIAWKYKGDSSWTNLVSLESLKGPTGATGATGPVGASGSNGTNAAINGMETLEIVAGSNISIEKNTTNKTITINSTVVGGGSGNVDLSNYYTKGQVDTKDTEIKNTIGTLGSLATTEKTNVVGAVNEVTTQLETVKQKVESLDSSLLFRKENLPYDNTELPSDFPKLISKGKGKYFKELQCASVDQINPYIFTLNSDGKVTWYKKLRHGSWIFKKIKLKGKTYYAYNDSPEKDNYVGRDYMEIVLLDENKVEVDRCAYKLENWLSESHEFEVIDVGHYILSSYVEKTVTNVTGYEGQTKNIIDAVIHEVKNGEKLYSWRSSDHIDLYSDTTNDLNNPQDYIHYNSIITDSRDGHWIMSFRSCNMCIKVNKTTGTIIWKLGGKNDQFKMTSEQKFLRQHHLRITPSGSYTIFDNRESAPTRILEFTLNEKEKTITSFQEYKWNNYFGQYCGACDKKANGIFAISWGLSGNKEVRWDFGEYDFNTNTANFEFKFENRSLACYRVYSSDF